jgi:hypothetical protein
MNPPMVYELTIPRAQSTSSTTKTVQSIEPLLSGPARDDTRPLLKWGAGSVPYQPDGTPVHITYS